MRLFGLYGARPMALARFSGMGLLRVRRREANPVSTAHYLRHTLSTLVAANLSGAMSAPPPVGAGEMTHAPSSSASLSGVGLDRAASSSASFVEAHAQYSFIAVVALMSLFLIITVTATGLMLAFCRKKNAVFTAPEKSDGDPNLELDDIDNSDVDICRGEKGECYYHLSDDYDDDDNDESVGEENDVKRESERARKLSKRSRTFPQLKKVLVRKRGKVCGIGKETQISTVDEPLMHKVESAVSGLQAHGSQKAALVGSDHANQSTDALEHQGAKPVCRNPNHKHYSRRHHNCLYNRPHFHNASSHHHHQHRAARLQHYSAACGSRLQRSHTIHYIPQTSPGRCDHRAPNACGVQIRVRDAETIALGDPRVEAEEVGTVQLHHVPTVSSSVRYNPTEVYQTEDLFADHDHDISFTNLQLRVVDSHHDLPTAEAGQAFPDPNTPTNPTPRPVGDTYTADQNAFRVKPTSNDSRLLGEFLTCATGSFPPIDCIFNRDKPPIEATPQALRDEQLGPPPPHQHYPHSAEAAQLSQATQFNPFHNLFTLETRSDADLTALVLSANAEHAGAEHPHRSRSTTSSTRTLPPPQASSNKRCIRHASRNDEIKTGDLDFPLEREMNHLDPRTNQRTSDSHVDPTVSTPDCNSNYGDGQLDRHPQLDMNILTDPDVTRKKNFASGVLLGARPGNAIRRLIYENEARRAKEGDGEEGDEDECNDDSARMVKTCNEIGSDEDQDDLTLSLLK